MGIKQVLRRLFARGRFPFTCELCKLQVTSDADLDWHGIGDCVPFCEKTDGCWQETGHEGPCDTYCDVCGVMYSVDDPCPNH